MTALPNVARETDLGLPELHNAALRRALDGAKGMSNPIPDHNEVLSSLEDLRRPLRSAATGMALACCLAVAACGSSSSHEADEGASNDGSRDDAGASDEDGPLYAVSADIFNSDFSNRTSLLWLVPDLSRGEVDSGDAVQLPQGATIWGVPKTGIFYVVSAESLTISKYRIREGAPEATGASIGLTSSGVTKLVGPHMIFDGSSRAFFLDILSAQALELDLDAMSITRRIDLSAVAFDPSRLSNLGERFVRRGDRYINTVFATSPNYDRLYDTSKIFFFDPRDGSFETKEVACGGLQYTVEASNGDLFISSDPYVASIHLVDPDDNPAPCMIRLPADSEEPDEKTIALNDLAGGPTGGLIAGPNDTAFLRVLDTTLYSPSPDATYGEPFSGPYWQTWQLHLDDPTSVEKTDRTVLAGGIKTFSVDGESYENDSEADFSATTLIRTTGEDAPSAGLKMPGTSWGIVRVR